MKKVIILLVLLLTSLVREATFAQSDTEPGRSEELPAIKLFNVSLSNGNKVLTPIIWQGEMQNQNYIFALGKAKLSEQPTDCHSQEIRPRECQLIMAGIAAKNDALANLQKYLKKDFFFEFAVQENPLVIEDNVYMIGYVPITPLPTDNLPQCLKSEDSQNTGLVLIGKVNGHRYLYALGFAENKNDMHKAIKQAKDSSKIILARYLGIREKDIKGFVAEKKSYAHEHVKTAWVLGRVPVD